MKITHSMKRKRIITDSFIYFILGLLCILWLIPVFLIVYTSLRNESGSGMTVVPINGFTFDHYLKLFSAEFNALYPYKRWIVNTLIVAVCSTTICTFFILSTSYTMSRLRFKGRKNLMSINLILGMFPGFMSMIAVYNILKAVNLTGSLFSLILCYSAASGGGFYIAKGFFDTIPHSLDEAARIDGATNAKVFFKITIPLSKPIIVYTLLTSFTGPWVDFIFAKVIVGNKPDNYTIALGLQSLISTTDAAAKYFTYFFAGSVIIAIPIMLLFMFTQKYYVEGITGGAVKG